MPRRTLAYRRRRNNRTGNYLTKRRAGLTQLLPVLSRLALPSLPSKPSYNTTRALMPSISKSHGGNALIFRMPRLTQRAIRDGTGGSFSKFSFLRRKVPRGFAAATDNYKVINGAGRMTVATGVQGAETHGFYYDVPTLDVIRSLVSSSDTVKFLVKSLTAELELTNQCKGNVRLKIYDIVCRRDCNTANNSTPSQAWKHNYAQEGGNDNDYSVVGTTPFSNSMFVKFYKVRKVTNVLLAQGQTHCHKVYIRANAIINKDTIDEVNYGFKGITRYTMVVAHGCPYNEAETKTDVSTGDVALDWIIRKQYKYTYISDESVNYSVTNTLPTLSDVHIMDIGSGEPEGDSNA